jgi:hypothetical protein
MPPPSADGVHADKYIKWLVELIGKGKLLVLRSDLSKFTVDSLHEHYRINLDNYDLEVSHSKSPDNEDMYIILFNNLRVVAAAQSERTILSYLQLSAEQFNQFKTVAEAQLNLIKKKQEEKRFTETMVGVDQELEKFASQNTSVVDQAVQTAIPEASPAPVVNQPSSQPVETTPTTPTPNPQTV